MNFIKKKKKNKKGLATDDDDFDPNLFGPRHSAPEGATEGWVPYEERLDQDSEEWAAFRQLTQRITDTVKKTQENLTKIVAESAVDEKGQNLKSLPTSNDQQPYSGELHIFNGQGHQRSSASQKPHPARPPPPKQSKPPPRPPPVVKQGAVTGEKFNSWDSPAETAEQTDTVPFDLAEEFGFDQPAPVPVRPSTVHGRTGSLFLDDEEEEEEELDGDDPFDTSFVDVSATTPAHKPTGPSRTTEDLFNNNWEDEKQEVKVEEEEDDPFIVKDLPDCLFMDSSRVKSQNPFLADVGAIAKVPPARPPSRPTSRPGSRPASRPPSRPPSTNPFIDDDDEDDDDYVVPMSSTSNPFAMAIAQMAEPFDFLHNVDDDDDVVVIPPLPSYKAAPDVDLLGLGFDSPSPPPPPIAQVVKPQIVEFFQTKKLFDPFGDPEPVPTFVAPIAPNPFKMQEPVLDLMADDEGMAGHVVPVITMSLDHQPAVDPFLTPMVEEVPRNEVIAKQPEKPADTLTFLDQLATPFQVPPGMDIPSPCMSEQPDAGEAHDAFDAFFASPAKVSAGATTIINEKKTLCYAPSEDWGDMDDEEPPFEVSTSIVVPPVMEDSAFALDWGTQDNFSATFEPKFGSVDLSADGPCKDEVDPWGDSVPVPIGGSEAKGGSDNLFLAFEETGPQEVSVVNSDPFGDVSMDFFGGPLDEGVQLSDGSIQVSIGIVDTEKPIVAEVDCFDAFEAKFSSVNTTDGKGTLNAFGDLNDLGDGGHDGFGTLDEFDTFLSLREPPAAPKPSPARPPPPSKTKPQRPGKPPKPIGTEEDSSDSSDSGPDFSVFIRPKMRDPMDIERDSSAVILEPLPLLPPPPLPPPKSPPGTSPSPRFNPFDKSGDVGSTVCTDPASDDFNLMFEFTGDTSAEVSSVVTEDRITPAAVLPPTDLPDIPQKATSVERTESQESPGSPLYDEDDTEPLEDFCSKYEGDGWEMMLRHPNKKKLTGQRFWKKVFLRLHDHTVLQLFNKSDDKEPFQELPLQACYVLSEVGAQQYDAYGKIFTVKLQYIFYKERVGVRPGQISKVTQKQVTTFGQLAKLGLPLEHAPQMSQLLKLGTQCYNDIKVFQREIEDSLFRLNVHRDRALTYRTEEVQVTVHDELYAEINRCGTVVTQRARVRVFFLAFLSGMPDVEIGVNDVRKKGREVVGRHDIIPVVTEEWIRVEKVEFHSCVGTDEFDKSRTVKCQPPDACFFELLRFRVRPPRNRELPLQVKVAMSVVGAKVEIRCDVLVPGYVSKRHGQVPCEDVAIRFPLPECWIYLFRSEKHFRYGSIKSAARKPGKIKGLERIMGAATSHDSSLIEVSTGAAKYEHQHRAIVWRIPRLPKEGQGAYTTQLFICRLELTSYDQIPPEYENYVDVEFIMPATTVSHTTIRSVSVSTANPPEKYVRYVSKHDYRVEIDHITETSECEYVAATTTATGNSRPTSNSPIPNKTSATPP